MISWRVYNLLKTRVLSIFFIFILSITVLWFICPVIARNFFCDDGHISSNQPSDVPPLPTPNGGSQSSNPTQQPTPLYEYYTISENSQDLELSMHILEVDLSNPQVIVRPVTSHRTLFGYKFLSEMSEEWQAEAAINAGFSHSNGLLGGFLCMGKELLIPATGNYPAIFIKDKKGFIEDIKTRVWVEGEKVTLENVYFNRYSQDEGIYIFTNSYGKMNRIDKRHLNAVISNKEVQGLIIRHESYEIPKDGFLISAIGKEYEQRLNNLVKPGMMLEIKYEVLAGDKKITGYDWGYECGSWIIKDYKIVAPATDGWVGTLQTRVPRTAVGVKEDGSMVFVVVDGRQKGLSEGLTLKELGRELLKLGVKDAVNLDGGASSEMIIEGKIVNSPSAGRERKLPAGFIIKTNFN